MEGVGQFRRTPLSPGNSELPAAPARIPRERKYEGLVS